MENTCKNNYTKEEYITEFAKDDNGLKNCNHCPNFEYEDGMMRCIKFDKDDKK